MNMEISGVLFDVGGVLVVLDGVPSLAKLLQIEESHDAIHRLWLTSRSVVLHETGKISAHEFAVGVVADLGLPMSPEAFLIEFAGWLEAPYPGAFALVEAIPQRYQVAVLSNMSALHWKRIVAMGLPARVERTFVSHETGHMKPSKEAFDLALSGMGLAPNEVLFLDDGVSNVNAARVLGMRAHVVRNPSEARSVLEEYGVINGDQPSFR
jgi:HAD superfamily hydrolase (TIGR01509 family)